MYNFHIEFSDKSCYDMEDVIKVEYFPLAGDSVSVTGEDLLTHEFPFETKLCLYSECRTYRTTGQNIASIEVNKAD